MATKLHFRDYNPKQLILFPERLDKDIAENDPVRVVDTVIDHLRLDNFKKLYKERGRSPYHPKMMLKAIIYGYTALSFKMKMKDIAPLTRFG